jgi:hypothetical protein
MTNAEPRDLEGVHNFRPLAPYPLGGGGRLKAGMIYRSGALELMTDADAEYLQEEVGIACVLDLRHPDELSPVERPHALADRVHALSIFREDSRQEDIIAELNGLYGMGPTPRRYMHYLEVGGPKFAQAFERFADEGAYPLLVHCTAGKDRTGVVLALVMDVLGVSHADIASEYGLSDASIDRLIAYLEASGRKLEGSEAEIRARLSTPPERMAGFMELVTQRYGSGEAYLRQEGVGDATFAAVRDILTDDAR